MPFFVYTCFTQTPATPPQPSLPSHPFYPPPPSSCLQCNLYCTSLPPAVQRSIAGLSQTLGLGLGQNSTSPTTFTLLHRHHQPPPIHPFPHGRLSDTSHHQLCHTSTAGPQALGFGLGQTPLPPTTSPCCTDHSTCFLTTFALQPAPETKPCLW